jgi:hypothetical protein
MNRKKAEEKSELTNDRGKSDARNERGDQKTSLKAAIMSLWNFWPPFLGSGIVIEKVEGGYGPDGWKAIDIKLKLRFWNSNYVGTQFGGSLFAMTDPFLMVMLVRRLGRDYIVWDKSSSIRFRRPGTSDCRAHFAITDAELVAIKARADIEGQFDWHRKIEIRDIDQKVVAEVDKVLFIATRDHYLKGKKK